MFSDVEENPRPRASHRFCRAMYANLRALHKNLLDLSLTARVVDVVFCSETFVSSMGPISELMVAGFGQSMQLLGDGVNRFRRLIVYVLFSL